jgi:aspartate dehydrogenase
MDTNDARKWRIGLIGYGNLGQYLAKAILNDSVISQLFVLVFVYNRTESKMSELPGTVYKMTDLNHLNQAPEVDIIVEVSHPVIIQKFGSQFLSRAHLFIGSPTALADEQCEKELKQMAVQYKRTLYIPSGALWGATDIAKMSERKTLGALSITMAKHPLSLKLEKPLSDKIDAYIADQNAVEPLVIYEGNVRDLCPLAPNNVNTMACAAIAGECLGFGKVQAKLIADKSLEAHVIDIDVQGANNSGFRVKTERYNPAKVGAVTGNATYVSFLSSLKACPTMKNNGGFCFC